MDRRETLNLVLDLAEDMLGRRPHPTRVVVECLRDPEMLEELLDDLRAHVHRDMPALRKLHPSMTFNELGYVVWELLASPVFGEAMLMPDMTFTADEQLYVERWGRALAQAEDAFPGYRASVGGRKLGQVGHVQMVPRDEGSDLCPFSIPLRALEALRVRMDQRGEEQVAPHPRLLS